MNMKAIRIEHENGSGIYRTADGGHLGVVSWTNAFFDNMRERHWEMSTPYGDGKLKPFFISGEHFCAFKNKTQMLTWVLLIELKELIGMGAKVYELEFHDESLNKPFDHREDETEVGGYFVGEDQIIYELSAVKVKKDITFEFINFII